MTTVELATDFRRRSEKQAADVRRNLGLQTFDPLSGERLAASLGIEIVTPEQLPALAPAVRVALNRKLWGGLLKAPNLSPVLLIRANQSPTRRQSTLMHEIAHYLLDHDGDAIATALGEATLDNRQEAEARYLGGCLQIPDAGLRWALQTGLSRTRVAAHFGASEAMLRWRCNATGVRV